MKALVHIDAAMKALAKATTVAEVKDLRDKAEAMRAYARNVNAGLEAQNRCAEWKIRCERKGGQMLIDMAERGERRSRGGGHAKSHDVTLLADLGIEKMQASRWMLLARMDEAEFEAELASCIDAGNVHIYSMNFAEDLGERTRHSSYPTADLKYPHRSWVLAATYLIQPIENLVAKVDFSRFKELVQPPLFFGIVDETECVGFCALVPVSLHSLRELPPVKHFYECQRVKGFFLYLSG